MSLEYTNMYISLKNLCSMSCAHAEKSGTGLDAIVFAHRKQWDKGLWSLFDFFATFS